MIYKTGLPEGEDINIAFISDGVSKFMTFPKEEKLEVTKEYEETIPTDWREFQKYCRDKGLKSGGKTRKELENELKGL